MDMSNFWKRTITGVLLVAVLIGGMLWSSWSYGVLFLIISLLGVVELATLFIQKGVKVQVPVTISTMERAIFYKQRGKILTQ